MASTYTIPWRSASVTHAPQPHLLEALQLPLNVPEELPILLPCDDPLQCRKITHVRRSLGEHTHGHPTHPDTLIQLDPLDA